MKQLKKQISENKTKISGKKIKWEPNECPSPILPKRKKRYYMPSKFGRETQAQECADWLIDRIGNDKVASEPIFKEALKKGFRDGTIRKAKIIANIKTSKEGSYQGHWLWEIPENRE